MLINAELGRARLCLCPTNNAGKPGMQVNPLERAATVGLEQLADLPGTVRYFLRSAPEMLEEALAMNWNDFAKQLDLLRLVRAKSHALAPDRTLLFASA